MLAYDFSLFLKLLFNGRYIHGNLFATTRNIHNILFISKGKNITKVDP